MNSFAQRSATAFACLAIAAGGAVWTGCGDDDVDKAIDEAQEQGQKAVEGTKDAAEEAKKGLPDDAQKQIDEAQDKASEAVEKAKKEAEDSGY